MVSHRVHGVKWKHMECRCQVEVYGVTWSAGAKWSNMVSNGVHGAKWSYMV